MTVARLCLATAILCCVLGCRAERDTGGPDPGVAAESVAETRVDDLQPGDAPSDGVQPPVDATTSAEVEDAPEASADTLADGPPCATDGQTETVDDGTGLDTPSPDALLDAPTAEDGAGGDLDAAPPPIVVPDDCPAIPPMCPLSPHLGMPAGMDQLKFQAVWQKEVQAWPWLQSTWSGIWSRWLPLKLEPAGPHRFRLHASWFNQGWRPQDYPPGLPKQYQYMKNVSGCAWLKPSLLPTGCVVVEFDVKLGYVTAYDFFPASPAGILAATLGADGVPVPACPGAPALPGLPNALTTKLADGTAITAHAGRASMHLLVTDPTADPSPLVRVVDGLTAPAIDVVHATPLPDGTTATHPQLDVSVCRATASDIEKSGCACPTATAPDPGQQPAGDFIRYGHAGQSRLLTPEFLSAVEAKGWDGVGMPKWTQNGLGTWEYVGHDSPCCATKACPGDAVADWKCAGSAGSDVHPWWLPTLADVDIYRSRYHRAMITVHGTYDSVPLPAMVTINTAEWKSSHQVPVISATLEVRNVPARQRDGAITTVAYDKFSKKPGTLVVHAFSPVHSRLTITGQGWLCRLHNFGTGSLSPWCAPAEVWFEYSLTRWDQ